MGKKYVLRYEVAEDGMETPVHLAAHNAGATSSTRGARSYFTGPFSNPPEEGSMAVFTTREAAERNSLATTRFVRNGVVRRWQIRESDEANG
jgi:hypothetical protein